jgi:hypothetical protein
MFFLAARSNLRPIAIHIHKSQPISKAPKCLARITARANLARTAFSDPIHQK